MHVCIVVVEPEAWLLMWQTGSLDWERRERGVGVSHENHGTTQIHNWSVRIDYINHMLINVLVRDLAGLRTQTHIHALFSFESVFYSSTYSQLYHTRRSHKINIHSCTYLCKYKYTHTHTHTHACTCSLAYHRQTVSVSKGTPPRLMILDWPKVPTALQSGHPIGTDLYPLCWHGYG